MRPPVVMTAGLVLLSMLVMACNGGCPEGYVLRGSVCHFDGPVKMDAAVEGTAKPGLMSTAGATSAAGAGAGEMSAGGAGGTSGVGVDGVIAGGGADAAAGRAGAAGSMDVNQCLTNNGGCDTAPMATCTNNVGAAPDCTCPSGYVGSGVGSDGCAVPGRFVPTTDTVLDNTTKLTWQRAVPTTYAPICSGSYENKGTVGDSCTWDDAGKYCTSLVLGGSGWRLPTKDELLSIVDMTRTTPAIDPAAFPDTPSDWFWTSSPSIGSAGGWIVHFSFGSSYGNTATDTGRVRCVR